MTTYFYATSSRETGGQIFSVSSEGGPTLVAEFGLDTFATNVARAPDGTIYATTKSAADAPDPALSRQSDMVSRIDPDGTVTLVVDGLPEPLSGLAFAGDGTLYGAIRQAGPLTDIVRLDPVTFERLETVAGVDLGDSGSDIDLTVRGDEVWASGVGNTGSFVLNVADPFSPVKFNLQTTGGIATTDENGIFIDRTGRSDDRDTVLGENGAEVSILRSASVTSDAYGEPVVDPEPKDGIRLQGGRGDDIIIGTDGDDLLSGNDGDDQLFGLDGDDTLSGGRGDDLIIGDRPHGPGGADTIFAGEGNDVIFGGAMRDTISGGDGNDQVVAGIGNDEVRLGGGDDIAFGGDGDDRIDGGEGTDVIYGGAGRDLLIGGGGTDFIAGGDGDDGLVGNDGNDFLYGGAGDDIVRGQNGNDQMTGDAGDDTLRGEAGNDVLFGGEGDDGMGGGEGIDVFFGGTGADTVILGFGGGRDFWADFEDGVDLIQAQALGITRSSFGERIEITSVEDATLISVEGNDLFLNGIDAANISAEDFILVPIGELDEGEVL